MADSGLAFIPPGLTVTEFAMGLAANRPKMRAMRAMAAAQASRLADGSMDSRERIQLGVDAGGNRAALELAEASRMGHIIAERMAAASARE